MIRLLLAALLLFALPGSAMAKDDDALAAAAESRAAQVVAVLQGTTMPEEVFSPAFLEAVPPSQIEALRKQLTDADGHAQAVEHFSYKGSGAATLTVRFEKALAEAALQLSAEEPHLIAGFRITNVEPIGDTPQKIIADIAALHGRASIGVYALEQSGPRAIFGSPTASEQLAIGSTFKLYVLSTLAGEVKAGKRHWSDVVPLGPPSLPSGQMQNWPAGAPVTLQTLASMMISISDNTAADNLIRALGRKSIEAELVASGHSAPARDIPFLTTIENFALKAGGPARIAAYAAANDERQRALLDEWAPTLTADNIDLSKLAGATPRAIDKLEWFASNEDVARIFARLRDEDEPRALAILSINKAIPEAQAKKWAYVGYKGGSELGVLNLSWLLKDRQGRWFVVSVSWNDPEQAVDESTLLGLSMRAIAAITRLNE